MIKPARIRVIIVWAFFLLPEMGCRESVNLQGSFWVETPQEQMAYLNKLELGPQGRGSWSKGEERTGFKWEMKKEQIWLHTKSGGVVTGKFVATDRIEITLPGSETIIFKKAIK